VPSVVGVKKLLSIGVNENIFPNWYFRV